MSQLNINYKYTLQINKELSQNSKLNESLLEQTIDYNFDRICWTRWWLRSTLEPADRVPSAGNFFRRFSVKLCFSQILWIFLLGQRLPCPIQRSMPAPNAVLYW